METLLVLTAFYELIKKDPRIGATHISLFLTFLHRWGLNGFQNPVAFTSHELMPIAKIESRATYHKCLHDLVESGYIIYIPSCNPFLKSLVYLKL